MVLLLLRCYADAHQIHAKVHLMLHQTAKLDCLCSSAELECLHCLFSVQHQNQTSSQRLLLEKKTTDIMPLAIMVLLVYARAYSTLSSTASWSTLKRSAMSRRRSGRLTLVKVKDFSLYIPCSENNKTPFQNRTIAKQRRAFIFILEKTDFFSSCCPTYPKDSLELVMIIVLCLGFEAGGGLTDGSLHSSNLAASKTYLYAVYHRYEVLKIVFST